MTTVSVCLSVCLCICMCGRSVRCGSYHQQVRATGGQWRHHSPYDVITYSGELCEDGHVETHLWRHRRSKAHVCTRTAFLAHCTAHCSMIGYFIWLDGMNSIFSFNKY